MEDSLLSTTTRDVPDFVAASFEKIISQWFVIQTTYFI